MKQEESLMILGFVSNYVENLRLRRIIIGAVGKVGEADAIRAKISEAHQLMITQLEEKITNWDSVRPEAKNLIYSQLADDIDEKLASELQTLKFLVGRREVSLSKNLSTTLLDRGITMHTSLVRNTLGLIAMINMISENRSVITLPVESQIEGLIELLDWFNEEFNNPRSAKPQTALRKRCTL